MTDTTQLGEGGGERGETLTPLTDKGGKRQPCEEKQIDASPGFFVYLTEYGQQHRPPTCCANACSTLGQKLWGS